jgi:transcriptional regulator with XRE-family HTH domain
MKNTLLKQIRIQSNTKQEIVAMTMNMSKSAVSKIESKSLTSLPIDKLERYLASMGGELEISITLADGKSFLV